MPRDQDDPLSKVSRRRITDLEQGLDHHGRQYLFSWLLDEQASGVAVPPVRSDQPPSQVEPVRRRVKRSGSRSAARALVSIMLSDGAIRESERAFVDSFLRSSSQTPLQPEEIRAWQPGELPAPDDPRTAVEALASLVHLDSQPDRSEWQLVREFARAWRVVDAELAEIEGRFRPREGRIGTLGRFLEALRRIAGGNR